MDIISTKYIYSKSSFADRNFIKRFCFCQFLVNNKFHYVQLYCILECPFCWWSKGPVANLLFYSIFIKSLGEKRVKVLKEKNRFFFPLLFLSSLNFSFLSKLLWFILLILLSLFYPLCLLLHYSLCLLLALLSLFRFFWISATMWNALLWSI